MHYRNFFWDFDGTLYDTYRIMPLAYHESWHNAGYEVSQVEAYQIMRLRSLSQAFIYHQTKYNISDSKLIEIREQYKIIENKHFSEVKQFAGATEILKQVSVAGGKNFLLTHRANGAVELLKRDDLKRFISGSITGRDNFPRKPAPDSLNYLLDKFKLERASAIMVGDRRLDIKAAHNAKIAGALFDPDNLMAHQKIHAEIKVHSLSELINSVS
ncbi:HAD-IA family hydrolase [Ligilactobacillus acidipiscis]|uniref:HAD-IA family hydrolase n=1 Tax=Ligilactobacillus acidipiscis TaxID=89059 RepID=UPI0023F854BE|nr:HAD-IA family hydrolase [Ligilactobacillus acidipiscis]WEV58055.1 HAD-IA family hydrolase [Ligilactobacillus acidipiscis]